MKAQHPVSPGARFLCGAALAGCLFFWHVPTQAETLISCPDGVSGDFYDRGFYVPAFPGNSLDSVQLEFSAGVAGTYVITLTARSNAYDGPILGTATESVVLAASTDKLATFTFPSTRITKNSRVCFILSLGANPGGSLFYSVPGFTGGCTEVVQTTGTAPPLSSFRRNGVKIVITGQDDLIVAPGESIQAAINAASVGDTVFVDPGTYTENISLRSGINVVGAGSSLTTLRGTGSGSVVTANSITNSRFEGFKVMNSGTSSSHAGIYVNGGSVQVNNNWVIGNLNGIRIITGSSAIVRNNVVEQNGSASNGFLDYGIVCLHSKPLIANNLVVSNIGVGIYFAWAESTGAQAINNTIVDNENDGIWCYNDANVIIKNNIVTGNSIGLEASHGAMPENSFNNVWNNGFRNYDYQSGGFIAPGLGDISVDPLFDPASMVAFALAPDSPCIDAGDPAPIYNDPDGTRNDMGAYGGPSAVQPGLPREVTSGFVFTSVGKIPTSEITRSGTLAGLANVSPDVAEALHIYEYKDAPFGGRLWLNGLFGSSDTAVRYYQVLAAKWTGATPPGPADFEPLTDPLSKVRYTISPSGTVTATLVSLGPDSGGLYQRTDSGYWAHPDLKLIWNTLGEENGRYDLICRGFNVFRTEVSLPSNELNRITVYVDNRNVTASIDSVRNRFGAVIPECGVIPVASDQENIQFELTAAHPGGFLRNFRLESLYGRNRNGGVIAADQYVGSHDGSRPFWSGITSVVSNSAPAHASGALVPWQTCAYQFRLTAWARTTDGFNHIYWRTFNDHYFISLGMIVPSACVADLDGDGDVDGADLAIFGAQYGRTNCVSVPGRP